MNRIILFTTVILILSGGVESCKNDLNPVDKRKRQLEKKKKKDPSDCPKVDC